MGRKKAEEKYARYDLFPTTHSSMVANYDYICAGSDHHELLRRRSVRSKGGQKVLTVSQLNFFGIIYVLFQIE
jgi:hypothetical protein